LGRPEGNEYEAEIEGWAGASNGAARDRPAISGPPRLPQRNIGALVKQAFWRNAAKRKERAGGETLPGRRRTRGVTEDVMSKTSRIKSGHPGKDEYNAIPIPPRTEDRPTEDERYCPIA